LERALPSDKQISRITFDILGVIHSGEFDIEVETVRPGKTIELVEARMVHRAEHTGAGVPRSSVTARVWRLSSSDTSPVAGLEVAPFPDRTTFESRNLSDVWPGGFIASLKGGEAPGGRPGRRQLWLTTDISVVDGEEDSTYAAFVKYCDSMNGMAVREDPREVDPLLPSAGFRGSGPGHQRGIRRVGDRHHPRGLPRLVWAGRLLRAVAHGAAAAGLDARRPGVIAHE
jgi:hypothetical protein